MKSFLQMTWMEFKLFLREPIGAFFTLLFPLMLLFLFGSIYGNEPSPFFNGYGSVDVSVPAYTAMIIATTSLMSLTITMASYREYGILRRLRTTPIRSFTVLASQVIVLLLMTIVGMLFLIIAGKLVFNMRFDGNILNVTLAFLLSSFSFFAFGFVLAGLMPSARTAQVVGMAVLYPMMFLSGAALPRELLPETVRRVAAFLPLTYVVNLLRGMWIGESWGQQTQSVIILLAILVVGVAISFLTFKWE